MFFTFLFPIFAAVHLNFKDMKKAFIHLVLPVSFVNQCIAKGVTVTEALSAAYGSDDVHFKVDVVPDNYFSAYCS